MSAPPDAARWPAFARTFLATLVLIVAGYLALAYLVDPYDSGRSTLLSAGAVRPQGPRTASALRGRDPAFAGAVFGNSHIQLVEPERLAQGSGIPFVQLSVPATGPLEQLTLMRWFLAHHPAPRALVVAADDYWCTGDPALTNEKPFPFWLLAPDRGSYLRGLLRWPVAQEVAGRIGWLLGKRHKTARPDGWWDYEQNYLDLGFGTNPSWDAQREIRPPTTPAPGRGGPAFPAAARFGDFVEALPARTALILVFPPVYAAALPPPGSARAEAEAACKAAIATAARRHARSAVIDWRRPRPGVEDPALFFDQTHYRHTLARRVTDEIVQSLRELEDR